MHIEVMVVKKETNLSQRMKPAWQMSGQDGLMTVEVSVIIPILCILIAAILFYQFFMIDMAAAKSLAMREATEAAACWKTGGDMLTKEYEQDRLLDRDSNYLISGKGDEEMIRQAEGRMKSLNSKRWILSVRQSSEFDLHNSLASVGRHLSFKVPLAGSLKYLGIGGWKFRCLQSAALDNWEEALRRELNHYE